MSNPIDESECPACGDPLNGEEVVCRTCHVQIDQMLRERRGRTEATTAIDHFEGELPF